MIYCEISSELNDPKSKSQNIFGSKLHFAEEICSHVISEVDHRLASLAIADDTNFILKVVAHLLATAIAVLSLLRWEMSHIWKQSTKFDTNGTGPQPLCNCFDRRNRIENSGNDSMPKTDSLSTSELRPKTNTSHTSRVLCLTHTNTTKVKHKYKTFAKNFIEFCY